MAKLYTEMKTATPNFPARRIHYLPEQRRVALGLQGQHTPTGVRESRARDLGVAHNAPAADNAEESNELYLEENCDRALGMQRRKGALLSAWQDEEDHKLRELMRTKERAQPTPTPPSGSL